MLYHWDKALKLSTDRNNDSIQDLFIALSLHRAAIYHKVTFVTFPKISGMGRDCLHFHWCHSAPLPALIFFFVLTSVTLKKGIHRDFFFSLQYFMVKHLFW